VSCSWHVYVLRGKCAKWLNLGCMVYICVYIYSSNIYIFIFIYMYIHIHSVFEKTSSTLHISIF